MNLQFAFRSVLALVVCSSLLGSDRFAFASDTEPDKTIGKPNPEAEARIYNDISFLASDDLKGRSADGPGLKIAANYIAERFRELGLKTDLFDGKPFQEFTVNGSYGAAEEDNQLVVTKPDGTEIVLTLGDDFNPLSLGSNGSFEAPLVFGGYGISADEDTIKYDDFGDVDVRGKVVIVLRKEPQNDKPDSVLNGTEPSKYAFFTAKEENAAKQGAAGLLFIHDAASEATSPGTVLPVAGAGNATNDKKVPTISLKRELAAKWIAEARDKTLTEI